VKIFFVESKQNNLRGLTSIEKKMNATISLYTLAIFADAAGWSSNLVEDLCSIIDCHAGLDPASKEV
jgi:hypothetical protein